MSNLRPAKIALYVSLIFLAGIVTGALLAPMIGRTFMRPPGSKQMSRHMLHHLQQGLSLTDAQMKQVRPLVEKTGADLDAIRRETVQRVIARVEATHAQISDLLTPEQRTKFEKMKAEERAHHPHRGHPPGDAVESPPPAPNEH